MTVASYSTNPALNTSISGIDISEGSAAAGYNDALRQMMADIRAWTDTYAVSYPISVANGGTGSTTAPAALTALGALSSAYRDLQPVTHGSAFTFADTERGKGINYTGAAAAATINPNATTAIGIGGAIVIRNAGTGALTVTRGAGVSLKKNGGTASADAVLAMGGIATLIQWAADDWTIMGAGIS
jgi:hypothetical protein